MGSLVLTFFMAFALTVGLAEGQKFSRTQASGPGLFLRRRSFAQQRQSNGMVPAVVKVVNTISDIGHGAQKVAQPLIRHSAAHWRRTVDDHIMPNVKEGLTFVGEMAAEGIVTGVDALAEAVMGSQAKQETSQAFKTLHKAFLEGHNETAKVSSHHEPPLESLNPGSYFTYETNQAYHHSPDLIQPRREYPNSVRLQQPAALPRQPNLSVEEALYILGKNFLGKNVTDRLLPVVKTVAKGVGQVGEGLSTFGQLLPPVDFEGAGLLPPGIVIDEEDFQQHQQSIHRPRHEAKNSLQQQRVTESQNPKCTTPAGGAGRCTDIQNCPLLLADLSTLRKSICFKSLFVPGVCCPSLNVNTPDSSDLSNQQAIYEETQVADLQELDVSQVQPQGTTKRPQLLPSLVDLPSTTPPPSPLLSGTFQTVPGTNQECGLTKIPQGRIVGGNTTFEGEHPWMVAIFLHGNGKREFWCGGALISSHTVVTAAHCTKDAKKRPFRPNQFTVRIGEWDLSDNDHYSQEFRVVEINAHPDFKPNGFYNDVAVFVLDQPVQFSEYVQPVCLPGGDLLAKDYTGSLPVVLGWGTTYYGGQEVSKLRGVSLPVWTRSDCDNSYFQPITEVFVCAGFAEGGRDACQGDSGGPLVLYESQMQRWMLLGIVSFGNRCAEPGYPGVYTNVPHFMPWLMNNLII